MVLFLIVIHGQSVACCFGTGLKLSFWGSIIKISDSQSGVCVRDL